MAMDMHVNVLQIFWRIISRLNKGEDGMISAIVVNYNDYMTTSDFIKMTLNVDIIDNIIVVDNCSTDDSFEQLKKLSCGKVDLIAAEENKGYATGNNLGAFYAIKKYNPEYIIIANPDIEVDNETVEYMVNFAQKSENLGAVTCLMKCSSDIKIPVASKLPTYKDCILENLIVLRKFIGNSLEYHDYMNKPAAMVDVLPGAFFLIEADIFREVGGFDESTFLYYEENILAYKLKQINRQSYLLTEKTYLHKHSVSINKNINSVKKRLEIAFQSRAYYCSEYLKCNNLQLFFHKLAFKIGLFDYLLALKISGKKR